MVADGRDDRTAFLRERVGRKSRIAMSGSRQSDNKSRSVRKAYRVPRVGILSEHLKEMVKDAELKGFGAEPSCSAVRGGGRAGEALY